MTSKGSIVNQSMSFQKAMTLFATNMDYLSNTDEQFMEFNRDIFNINSDLEFQNTL